MRDRLRGCQKHVPFPVLCLDVVIMGNRFSPFPSFLDPSVNRCRVNILISQRLCAVVLCKSPAPVSVCPQIQHHKLKVKIPVPDLKIGRRRSDTPKSVFLIQMDRAVIIRSDFQIDQLYAAVSRKINEPLHQHAADSMVPFFPDDRNAQIGPVAHPPLKTAYAAVGDNTSVP